MDRNCFESLLKIVGPRISKHSKRESISACERLMVAIRFLATGESFVSLSYSTRIANQTISNIVSEVCEAITDELAQYISMPSTEEGWKEIANGFETRWQFPHCLGAIDGKHIEIRKPEHSGSLYYNYKGFFSVVLLAICDFRYRIVYAHYGSYGAQGDAGIFGNCDFTKRLRNETLNLPEAELLNGTDYVIPFYFIGDGAFPISKQMMKPFAGFNLTKQQRIYNYRLSRARRTIENVFGILAAKWRILQKPIETHDRNVDKIIGAIISLHNFLIEYAPRETNPTAMADTGYGFERNGEWRNQVARPLQPINPAFRRAYSKSHHSGDEQGEISYIYASELNFLIPHLQERPSVTSTLRVRQQTGLAAPSREEINEIESCMKNAEEEIKVDESGDETKPSANKEPPKKRKNSGTPRPVTPIRKRTVNEESTSLVDAAILKALDTEQRTEDENESYCKSLAAFMKKLPMKKNIQFRLRIEQLKLEFCDDE